MDISVLQNNNFTIIDPWSAKINILNNYTIHSTTKYIVTF